MTQVPFPQSETYLAIAIGYVHAECIAEQVLPVLRVSEEKFTYHEFDMADQLLLPDTKVGRKSKPNEIEFSSAEKTDTTKDYALDDFVPNSDLDKARPGFDPKASAANMTMQTIKLDQEKRVANRVFSDDAYLGNQIEDVTGTPFNNPATPVVDILGDAIDSATFTPTQMTMGFDVFSGMRRNPQILKAIHKNNGDAGIASKQQLEELFDVKFLVGRAKYNIAPKGQPIQFGNLWQNHIALQHIDQAASTNAPSMTHGFIAHYDDVGGEFPETRGVKGGVTVRVGHQRTEVISAPIAGYFIKNAI